MIVDWLSYLCAVLALAPVRGFPTFPALIPNGLYVPCPSHFDESQSAEQCALEKCKGVGHVDCRGGDFPNAEGEFLNAFGKAFRDAGRQWTTELCNADSDGDGKTNGEELGDPCCVWKPKELPTVGEDYHISHPGHAEDVTDSPGPTAAECQALVRSQGTAAAFDKEAYIDSLYNPGEDRLNITFRVQEHTLLPNETMYTEAIFPLNLDQDYYIVGYSADIVNKVHMHHFVVYLCTVGIDELYDPPRQAGFPQQPKNEEENGDVPEECFQQNFYNWGPGGDQLPLPSNMAIKIAKDGGYKSVFMQIHYNNPEGATDAMDSSGFTAYATSKPREHELAAFWVGTLTRIGDIPPKKEAYFNTGECQVQLADGCTEVNVIMYVVHAHFLGRRIWTEHYRPDKYGQLTYVGEIGRADDFNYELQYARMLDQEITVRDGDVLTTTCVFDSTDKTEVTPGGLGSQEEMCVNFMMAHPAQCLTTQCFVINRAVSGDAPSDLTAPYHTPDLYSVGGAANYTAVAEDGLATCNATAVFDNSAIGPSGPVIDRLFASIEEACPWIFGSETSGQGLMTPQEALAYECPASCTEWLINFGVCIATDLKAQYELLQNIPGAGGFEPSLFVPPSCHEAVAKHLTEQAGGTYSRAIIPETAAAAREHWHTRALWAAIFATLLLL